MKSTNAPLIAIYETARDGACRRPVDRMICVAGGRTIEFESGARVSVFPEPAELSAVARGHERRGRGVHWRYRRDLARAARALRRTRPAPGFARSRCEVESLGEPHRTQRAWRRRRAPVPGRPARRAAPVPGTSGHWTGGWGRSAPMQRSSLHVAGPTSTASRFRAPSPSSSFSAGSCAHSCWATGTSGCPAQIPHRHHADQTWARDPSARRAPPRASLPQAGCGLLTIRRSQLRARRPRIDRHHATACDVFGPSITAPVAQLELPAGIGHPARRSAVLVHGRWLNRRGRDDPGLRIGRLCGRPQDRKSVV